jgi:exopolyphosphatase / guanosine-5'-triphosphate,3'-diphosphate pyrophosphatase
MRLQTRHGDAMGRRIAAIDIGSNTVRGMAAEMLPDGRMVKFADSFAMTALGRGLAESHRMDGAAIKATAAFVREFMSKCEPLDAVRCVGTAAARDAENAGELAQALRNAAGVSFEVLSGWEEGELTFAGALSAIGDLAGEQPLVADIGGRSTEVAIAEPAGLRVVSLGMGARSVTEDYLLSEPPTVRELAAAGAEVRRLLGAAVELLEAADVYVVAGGTACSAALLAGDRWALSQGEIGKLQADLSAKSLSDRRAALSFDPARAEVICGGLVILEELAARSPDRTIHISIGGLREGILMAESGATQIVGAT